MIDHGAIARDNFGDSVGEVFARSAVGLHDGAVSVGADYDQRARVMGLALHCIVSNFNGLRMNFAPRNFDEMDAFEEGGVQRREGVLGECLPRCCRAASGMGSAKGLPGLPGRAGDRCDIGEAPLFVARGRKSQLGKALESAVAQGLNPRLRFRLRGEFREPRTGLFGGSGHTRAIASASSRMPSAA